MKVCRFFLWIFFGNCQNFLSNSGYTNYTYTNTDLIKFACHTLLMPTDKVEISACEIAKPFIFEFIEWSAMITNEPCYNNFC